MDNMIFEEKEFKCKECGKIFKKKYVPFIKTWIGECECIINREKEDNARREEQKRQFKIENNIRNSGIPKLYRDSRLDNFKIQPGTKKALNAARAYVERFDELADKGQGIIFIGNTGSGKTRLVTAIGYALLAAGHTVKFISFTDLIDIINRADDYGKTEADKITELTKCKLLILDDICVTNIADRFKRVIYSIVDKRINAVKPTIFTSNISRLEDIKTMINEQVFDRIAGSCAEIKLLTSSYRQKKDS